MTHTYARYVLIHRSAADVWPALTKPHHLEQWFCDRAAVDLRVGGAFEFTGETVFGGGGGQRVEALNPGRALTFSWTLRGLATRVTWLVEEAGGSTRVTARHEFPDAYTSEADEEQYTLWSFYLDALKAYLEAGRAVCRHHWRRGAAGVEVRHEVTLAAPAGRVWAALTEPALMDAWLSETASVELAIGGRFSYGWEGESKAGPEADGPRRVVELDPGRVLAYSWDALGTPTVVRWTIEADGAGARLTLVHSGFVAGARSKPSYDSGWADYLNLLAIYLATGEPARQYIGSLDADPVA